MNNPTEILVCGVDASGNKKYVLVDDSGGLVTSGGGNGGGGGGITQAQVQAAIEAANNLDQLETLTQTVANNIGGSNSLVATDDTGNWNLSALVKRFNSGLTNLNSKIPALINNRIQTESKSYRPDIVATPVLAATIAVTSTATTRAALSTRTKITITNVGTNPVYVDVVSGISTTKYLALLQPNEILEDKFHTGIFNFICATGQTSTLEIREWQ